MIKHKFLPIIIIVTLALGFGGGVLFSRAHGPATATVQQLINQAEGQPQNVDFAMFWKAWDILNQKYVDKSKIDYQKMVYGAIAGMVDSVGDPYTVFFEPTTAKQFAEQIQGAFGGVGLEIGQKDGVLTVIAPIKDTPAYNAGIRTGDKILKIDGTSTTNMSVDTAVSMIRGKKGAKVTLTVKNETTTKDYDLIRDTIKVPAVEWKMIDRNGKHIAYMQVYQFSQNVDSQFKTSSEEILKSNADSLIIDLRNNPGGLLDSAINLAGWMLNKGEPVVSEIFGNGSKNEFSADGNSALKKYPTVLLVNGGSASASEILAGALHDDRNIKLIGEKTFGKGSVQEVDNLDNGSSLKVTIAKWYTPAGINISAQGIKADIEVKLSDDEKKALVPGDPTKDSQLSKALDVLSK